MKTLDRGINETELMIALVVEKTSRTRKNERTREGGREKRIWKEKVFLVVSAGGAFLIYKRGIRFFIALFAPLFQQA